MKVAFLSPHFPEELVQFTRALKEIGAEVYGIADVPEAQLPANVRAMLSGYVQVDKEYANEEQSLATAVAYLKGKGIERVEVMWEPVVLFAAKLRERLGLPGMTHDVALGFRDKDVMKQRIRAAGLRTAKANRVRSAADIYASAEEFGFPIIVKPISAAGSVDTYKLRSKEEIAAILPKLGHLKEGVVEEFIDGEEFTWDAVAVGGEAAFYSVNQYFPVMLQSRTFEWISPADITFKDPDIPKLAGGNQLGKDAIRALGMESGFIHMEWFLTSKGEAVFGEIACRNGGGHIVDLINFANDFDIFVEWARVALEGKWSGNPARRYYTSMVCKRAQGQGIVRRIEGLDKVRKEFGAYLVREELVPVGQPRKDWLKSITSDGFLLFRHPDYDTICQMRDTVVNDVRMFAS